MSWDGSPAPSFVERLAPLRGSAGDVGLKHLHRLYYSPRGLPLPRARGALVWAQC
jgi:hypothetical protein